jgi:hypothetical protein
VRLVLLERNEAVPNHNDHPKEPEPITRNKKMQRYARVLLPVGAGLYILLSLFNFIIMDLLSR